MDEEKWSDFINKYKDEKIVEYLNDLDEKDKEIILIAHEHLESSFSITRSNGYKLWIKNNY